MRHGRPDYARIQDPMGIIPEDEPVFLLRARDAGAPLTVLAWSSAQEAAGADPEVVAKAREWAQVMSAYQAEHGMKLPDLPADEVVWPPEEDQRLIEEIAPAGSRWVRREHWSDQTGVLPEGRVVEIGAHIHTAKVIGYATDHGDEPPFVITREELLTDWVRVYTAVEDLVDAEIVDDDDELAGPPGGSPYGTPASYVPRRADPETVVVSDPAWQTIQRVVAANATDPPYRLAARLVAALHQAGHLTTTYPESCPASS